MTIRIITFSCLLLLSSSAFTQSFPASSLLITEVMFDPNPTVHLSDNEYIEFYNDSQDTISIFGWIWQVGDKNVILPDKRISPYQCLIIGPSSTDFGYNCEFLALKKWLTLSNSGQSLVLKDPLGKIIHSMAYSPGLYTDALKRAGGWSLELVCQELPFSANSWIVSWNPAGGSPGSVQFAPCKSSNTSDFKAIKTGYLSDSKALIYFNQSLHPDTEKDALDINFNEINSNWSFYNDRLDCLLINVLQATQDEVSVSVSVSGDVSSCSNKVLIPDVLKWGIPKQPIAGDLVITEVMFEPDENGIEFVEIFNNSEYIFDISDLIIATVDETGNVKDYSDNGASSHLIFPKQYVAVSRDQIWMKRSYRDMPDGAAHERKDLPTLINSGGGIRLLNHFQEVIDEILYHPDWHYSRLSETKGVSLERMSASVSGTQSGNWFSASALSSYSTPGLPNSQKVEYSEHDALDIQLINAVILANYDGVKDKAVVSFKMDKSGYMGQLEVRDLSGFVIRIVHPWGLLPKVGQLFWEGIDSEGRKAKDGLYILLFNYRHSDGDAGRWKKAVGVYHY